MFAVIDVETTGFSPANDRIVELCILFLDTDFRVTNVFDSLLNPERSIPWKAREVHRIDDSDVQHALPERHTSWPRHLRGGAAAAPARER